MIFESKMAYMYILVCANGGLYVGSTHSIDKRIAEHNAGEGANYTKKNLPVKLVLAEKHTSISSAFRREQQVKKWSRKKKIALIENNQEELIELAKKKFQTNNPTKSNKIPNDSQKESERIPTESQKESERIPKEEQKESERIPKEEQKESERIPKE